MRYLFSALAAIFVAASAIAGPITPEQALERLNSTSGPAKIKAERNNVVLRHTAETLKGEPAVYVFNRGDNDGYMLLSADDSAAPMLGGLMNMLAKSSLHATLVCPPTLASTLQPTVR